MDTHTYEDLQSNGSDMPWIRDFGDQVIHGKDIDEDEVSLYIYFPKGHSYVGVHMMVKPHPLATNERRRQLVDIELYTTPGQSMFYYDVTSLRSL